VRLVIKVFSSQGVLHHEFIPEAAIAIKDVLAHLWEDICLKCQKMQVAKD